MPTLTHSITFQLGHLEVLSEILNECFQNEQDFAAGVEGCGGTIGLEEVAYAAIITELNDMLNEALAAAKLFGSLIEGGV